MYSQLPRRDRQEIKVGDEKNRNNQPAAKPVKKNVT